MVQLDDLGLRHVPGGLGGEAHHQHRADREVRRDEARSRRSAARAAARGRSRSCRSRRARRPRRTPARSASAVSGRVKSTTTSASRQHLGERRAERRVGAAGQLHVVGALDRVADGRAHAPGGAGDGDADHARRPPRRAPGASGAIAARKASSSGRSRRPTGARARTARRRARRRSSSVTASIRSITSSTDSSGTLAEDMRAEPVHARAGRLQRQHDAALEVLLRARAAPRALAGSRRSRSSSRAITASACARLSGRVPTYRPTCAGVGVLAR